MWLCFQRGREPNKQYVIVTVMIINKRKGIRKRLDLYVKTYRFDGCLARCQISDIELNGAVPASDGEFVLAEITSAGAWLFVIDQEGEVECVQFYGGALWDRLTSLALTADNELVLGGFTTSSGAGNGGF